MVMFDWCISGRAESVLDTVSNPFQEMGISALRACEMVTCCHVTNSSFFWHCDAVRVNTTGSDSTQQTFPNTGGTLDWWECAAVLFSSEPFYHVSCDWFQKFFKGLLSHFVYLFMLPFLLTPEEKLQMWTIPLTKCYTGKVLFTWNTFGCCAWTCHL